jgi:hypothetical protein
MQDEEDDFMVLYLPDLPKINIKEIPQGKMVEVFEVGKKGYDVSLFEGFFAWQGTEFCAFVRRSENSKFWDSTLGLHTEMEAMKQIVEVYALRWGNIENIDLQEAGEYCYFSYDMLLPNHLITMQEALDFSQNLINRIEAEIKKIKSEVKMLIATKIASL